MYFEFRNVARRLLAELNVRQLVFATRLNEWYWRVAPSVHRSYRHLSPGYVNPPINPFRLYLVDPSRITRFTGREYPLWTDRWADFGSVVDGDWDRRRSPPVREEFRGVDPSLYLAERFTETPIHEALRRHFVDEVPWSQLEFIDRLQQEARSAKTSVWQDCKTPDQIRQYCTELDRLYESMRDQGCLSMRKLNRRDDRQMTFRKVMENEILVDVARTGELLFVTGRHRLSLAKILGLDRVPVAVVVRHPQRVTRHERTVGEPLDVSW